MILSFTYQASVFLTAAVIGAVIGFVYDLIRILRLLVRHKKAVIHIEDAVFWTLAVFGAFTVMLEKNNGDMRFFVVAGVALGMLIYFSLPSTIVMGCAERAAKAVKILLTAVLRPFIKVCRIIFYPVKKLNNFLEIRAKKCLHLCKLYAKLRIRKILHSFKAVHKK